MFKGRLMPSFFTSRGKPGGDPADRLPASPIKKAISLLAELPFFYGETDLT
jgi:hypothetical protein